MSGLHHGKTSHSPPHVRKSAAAKAGRSAPGISQPKPSKKQHRTRKHHKEGEEEEEKEEDIFDFEDDDMATSFLQYCAMCEKQILVPNSSFLYCSEHCKRMDAVPSSLRPESYFSLPSPHSMKERYPTVLDPFGPSLPRYVPAMQPTPNQKVDARIPPKQHNARGDLDPTEWKPAETSSNYDDHGTEQAKPAEKAHYLGGAKLSKRDSETLLYLSKFHGASMPETKRGRGVAAPEKGARAMPSLSHASTATASSSSSSASSHSDATYSFASRPPVSVPTTSMTSTTVLDMGGLSLGGKGQVRYEKKPVGPRKRKSAASGSLKKLLGGENEEV